MPRLGDLLVECGVLSRDRLASALARQRTSGRLLGAELVAGGDVASIELRRALRRQRWLALAAWVAMLSIAVTDDAIAGTGTGRADLAVSVVVPAVAVLQVQRQQPELIVTAADIARGYVDVPAASRVAIHTTSRSGCMLDFHPRLAVFRSVSVVSSLAGGEIGPDGGTLVARGATGHLAAEISYRFHLDDTARPGAYPWPLAVSVRPL